ncbi:MAG TPA: acetyl-CoA carboxylase biotin carboxyl carrier protein subunit [Bacteroidota bacterium]|jgi:pyruvate carboxylase
MQTPETLRELVIGGVTYETRYTKKFEQRAPYVAPDPHIVRCVIPGVILSVAVRKGSRVRSGDPLLVLEAMKMQNEARSTCDGTVRALRVSPGDTVTKGQILLELD